jgi:Integrase zinc binding domain
MNVDSTCIETAQRNDTELCQLINFVLVGQHPPQNQVMSWSPDTKAIYNQFDRLIINQQNILCRVYVNIGSHDTLQVIIPRPIRKQFLYQLHLDGGHLGRQCLEAAVRQRAYWPGWSSDIQALYRQCPKCNSYKKGTLPHTVPMKPIIAGDVWETISIDISGPYPPSHGFVYILSVQCLFSKFVQAFPMRKQTAIEVALILFGNLFTRFGFPAHIISDQGHQFDGELFHQLCKFANFCKLRTTPYKASTNGQVERWHRTLHTILAKIVQENHRNWHFHIPSVVKAYNSTKNKVTQFTPN